MSATRLAGRTALVTGAASGIGRATAVALAARGCHLAVIDVDGAGLAETVRLCAARSPIRISDHRMDVTDRDAIARLPAAVEAAHDGLDILVNNAGVALGGLFEQIAEEDFDWLMAINFFAVVGMTRAFLPMLRQSDDARIVNVSSLFGLITPPGQTAYVASKFAVRGFSDSLRHELAGSRIGVTTVHPGGVATAVARNARVPKGLSAEETERRKRAFSAHLKLPPEDAATAIVHAIETRKLRLLIGRDAKIAAAIERLFPVRHWNVLKRLSGDAREGERP